MNTKWNQPGPRHEATLRLLQVADRLWNGSRLLFAHWHINPSQFNVLNLLRNYPDGCSQVELSRALIMNRSNVTGLVDRLEARHLVQRRETPGDRRAYRVVLTKAGQTLVEEMLPSYYQGADEVWNGLSSGQVQQFCASLEKVRGNAEKLITQLPN
jgi:DNA-binding MarR family transcriptional regulator